MRLAVWKYFPKIWYLTFSSVQHLMTFQLSRFDHTEATIDTSWVQFNVFPHVDDHICLRRFEAGVETFPHISHKKCFCQWFVPFERRVTQCSNVWQNGARNKGFHLKHTQRAWVLVSELTYIHMGFSPPLYFSPLWKSSWVFKAVVLVKYFSQHLQCLHW